MVPHCDLNLFPAHTLITFLTVETNTQHPQSKGRRAYFGLCFRSFSLCVDGSMVEWLGQRKPAHLMVDRKQKAKGAGEDDMSFQIMSPVTILNRPPYRISGYKAL